MPSFGLDFGSVFTKAVLLDGEGCVEIDLCRKRGRDDLAALNAFLDEIEERHQGGALTAGVVGTSRGRAAESSLIVANPILSIGAGVRMLHPRARSVIEIGGHTSKFVLFDDSDGEANVLDFATNEACAAGTGSFLEQQARRLDLTVDELAAASLQARNAATIAGRCSVFAKSDMIHLQQKGTPIEEIAYGLCMAICRNAMTTLLKGREASPPLVIAGGCARNAGVLRAFRAILGREVDVFARPGLEAAIGAAAIAMRNGAPLDVATLRGQIHALLSERGSRPTALPALDPCTRSFRIPEPERVHSEPVVAFLGADVGSVSTDLVLLDENQDVVSAVYLPTRGRPVEVLQEGLDILRSRFPAGLEISGCGATGSGRYLAARLLGADVVKNEITCQILGARRFVPAADTIFEIGGQDSKFIVLRNGALADFAMNKICAAGTGSFLEEQAREIGIEIERDFASRAFAAGSATDLGTRCTVFIETEVVNALQDGADPDEICAGLARSIVRNYLDKVVGGHPLGTTIVFQGGVASNDAVVAAFESQLGQPIHVHPYNRISGAIGAAIAAIEARSTTEPTRFRSIDRSETPSLRSFECRHCSNRCEVNVLTVGGERAFFGDTCERYTSRTKAMPSAGIPPNLAEEWVARCEGAFEDEGGKGLTIGIPRASTLVGSLPFWATFFKSLGHRPILSAPSSEETLTLGLRHLSVGVCLPIKLAAGHIHSLISRGVDLVFVPSVVVLPGDDPSHSYACPYAMAVPFIVGTAPESRVLAPVTSFRSEDDFLDGFEPCRERLGATRATLREAFRAAVQAQMDIDDEFRDRARELVERNGYRRVLAVLGKPYNTLDGYLNLSLFERLRRLGVLAIPQKFLPLDTEGASSDLPWRYSADIQIAAATLARREGIHAVVVSNFGCGPDAFTFRQLDEILDGRPHLMLEFDEHRGEAGLITRVEAFLDQLDAAEGARPGVAHEELPSDVHVIPAPGTRVRVPYFADQAHAFSGWLRLRGCDARVLPPPTTETRLLGEKHSLGKECHAYSMMAGDLLELSRKSNGERITFYFPGTALPCLLHQYGNGMRTLLTDLGIENITVASPTGADVVAASDLDTLEQFYLGLMSIELLVKAVCQIRPYERDPGMADTIHDENLHRIEDAIAGGNILPALDESLERLATIPVERNGRRPIVGVAGDVYTKSNFVANDDLVRWLEDQGLEVWPSPFQIDLLDFGISRRLMQSVSNLDGAGLLRHGSVAASRALQQWRVRRVVGARIARQEEPGYLEMRTLTAPYMPNESHELLFINVAKIVDFARNGVDGIINAICFNCMVGNASAAIIEKIRRDYDDIPIITAVYAGGNDPSRGMILDAFVHQVRSRHARRAAEHEEDFLSRVVRRGRDWMSSISE